MLIIIGQASHCTLAGVPAINGCFQPAFLQVNIKLVSSDEEVSIVDDAQEVTRKRPDACTLFQQYKRMRQGEFTQSRHLLLAPTNG